jgi:hypothetical protein
MDVIPSDVRRYLPIRGRHLKLQAGKVDYFEDTLHGVHVRGLAEPVDNTGEGGVKTWRDLFINVVIPESAERLSGTQGNRKAFAQSPGSRTASARLPG